MDSFDYSTVFGSKRLYTYPESCTYCGQRCPQQFDNTVPGHLSAYVLGQPPGGTIDTPLKYLQHDQYLALTWIGVVDGGSHSEPRDEAEWDVFEDQCRMMYDEYIYAYDSATPEQRGSMPAPDYSLFTNNAAFIDTLFSYRYFNPPVAKEFGPYIIRNFRLITEDPCTKVPTYEVSYYNADNAHKLWYIVRVEERAILKLAPLLREQDILEDIRFNPTYSGHAQKCAACGIWNTVHGSQQCIPDVYESDDDRATVILSD